LAIAEDVDKNKKRRRRGKAGIKQVRERGCPPERNK